MNYRKLHIGKLLTKTAELIQNNHDITIANIMVTVFRPQNITSDNKDPYYMSDVDFSASLETTLHDLNDMINEK